MEWKLTPQGWVRVPRDRGVPLVIESDWVRAPKRPIYKATRGRVSLKDHHQAASGRGRTTSKRSGSDK